MKNKPNDGVELGVEDEEEHELEGGDGDVDEHEQGSDLVTTIVELLQYRGKGNERRYNPRAFMKNASFFPINRTPEIIDRRSYNYSRNQSHSTLAIQLQCPSKRTSLLHPYQSILTMLSY